MWAAPSGHAGLFNKTYAKASQENILSTGKKAFIALRCSFNVPSCSDKTAAVAASTLISLASAMLTVFLEGSLARWTCEISDLKSHTSSSNPRLVHTNPTSLNGAVEITATRVECKSSSCVQSANIRLNLGSSLSRCLTPRTYPSQLFLKQTRLSLYAFNMVVLLT